MPRLIVHERVIDDVQTIARYIADDNLPAALRFYDAAQMAFDFLASTPGAGTQLDPPLDSIADLRFWPITRFHNYLILYKPLSDGVEIVRVIHGARDLAKAMREG